MLFRTEQSFNEVYYLMKCLNYVIYFSKKYCFRCNLGYACSSPHMKPCRNGNCIAIYFFCDGENDCRDWSDELNCTGSVSELLHF